MIKKKKIGLITPSLQSGGAERVLSLTSRLLTEDGYEIFLFVFETKNISYKYQGKLVDFKSSAGKNLATKVIKRVTRILKLSYYKYKYDLDTVISFLSSANIVNYYSIGRANKILACRGYGDYILNGKKYSRMLRKIKSFIVQTERMKCDFTNDFNTDELKINIIYNPIDIGEINDKSNENIEADIQKFINEHKTICTVGTFKKDKGYWHLVKSFIKVKQSVKDAGLIFIGHRGEMENEIKEMARLSGYNDDILFLNYQENPFKYISKCDLYVCSSLYEGFPNALVEAMACGIPVISTDCKTGPREILCAGSIEGNIIAPSLCEYGILVPNLGEEFNYDVSVIEKCEIDMAEGITRLLVDKEINKKYAEASLLRANDFNYLNYMEKLKKLLNDK